MIDFNMISCVLTYGVALIFFIAGGLVTIVYLSYFIEEKIKSFIKILKYLQWIILMISGLLVLGDTSVSVKISTLMANVAWLLFTKQKDFPRVEISNSISFFSFIFTVFSHFFWLYFFMCESDEIKSIASYFVIVVWLVPLLILATVMAADDTEDMENNENENNKSKPQHKKEGRLQRIIKSFLKVDSLLPNKYEKDM